MQNTILDLLSWSKLFRIQAKQISSIESRENLNDVALKMDQVANTLLTGKDYFGNAMDPSEVGQALLRLWRTTHDQEWRFSTLNVLGEMGNQIRLILSYLRDAAENLLREDFVRPDKPLVLEEIKAMMNPIGVCKYCRKVIEAKAGLCPFCKKTITHEDIIENLPQQDEKISFIPKKITKKIKIDIPGIFFLNEKTERCECRKCGFAPYEEGKTEDLYCRNLKKCPSCGAKEESGKIKVIPAVKHKTILPRKLKKKAKAKEDKAPGILHHHEAKTPDVEEIEEKPVQEITHKEKEYGGLATQSPWPCEGKDEGRTGLTGMSGPKKGRVIWSQKAGSNLIAPPVIGIDGNIYLGTMGAGFVQIKKDGKSGWTFSMVNNVISSACISSKGFIYFSLPGKTYKLNPDGSPAWVVREGSNFPPALDKEGNLYVISKGDLVCLRGNREIKWRVPLGCDPDNRELDLAPSIGPAGNIYISTDHLLAFNNAGEQLFHAKLIRKGTRPVVDSEGVIYVGTENRILCLNPEGKLYWQYELGDQVSTPPVLTNSGNMYFGTAQRGTLYCITNTGARLWDFKGDSPITGTPSVDLEGNAYFANQDGNLFCVNPKGKKKWCYSSKSFGFLGGGMFNSSPAIGENGIMYASCQDGKLYAFE
ncbi:MAG: PQQ-binding-like beta-propeller repeat protein [Candidatus Eremiobacteraeota bacterium]|nr:PQQ-binding-like beta-propeller repeat protein [Candidatus Eremiobacteraeota bacterium]